MEETIRLGGITANSVVDGPGLRTVVFLQGCPRHCPGCHNEELLDPKGGTVVTLEELLGQIRNTISPITSGITISGGDPLMQRGPLEKLLIALKKEFPKFSVWLFTGYRYEDIKDFPLLQMVDVLVDGPFEQDKRDWDLAFRGSSNQRLIDINKTRELGTLVEWQESTKNL